MYEFRLMHVRLGKQWHRTASIIYVYLLSQASEHGVYGVVATTINGIINYRDCLSAAVAPAHCPPASPSRLVVVSNACNGRGRARRARHDRSTPLAHKQNAALIPLRPKLTPL